MAASPSVGGHETSAANTPAKIQKSGPGATSRSNSPAAPPSACRWPSPTTGFFVTEEKLLERHYYPAPSAPPELPRAIYARWPPTPPMTRSRCRSSICSIPRASGCGSPPATSSPRSRLLTALETGRPARGVDVRLLISEKVRSSAPHQCGPVLLRGASPLRREDLRVRKRASTTPRSPSSTSTGSWSAPPISTSARCG